MIRNADIAPRTGCLFGLLPSVERFCARPIEGLGRPPRLGGRAQFA